MQSHTNPDSFLDAVQQDMYHYLCTTIEVPALWCAAYADRWH
jgi:hypothetical protein